jgi:hypothetical protein
MSFRLVAPVGSLLKNKVPQPAPQQGVSELLAALAATRAQKAELEQREQELVLATRAKLREQQEALEELRKRVRDSGIETDGDLTKTSAPSEAAADGTAPRSSQAQLLNN